jgi:thiamine-phosphate pyrophosphorylase
VKAEIPAGLYVITDSGLCASAGLRQAVADAIDGGAVIVQYRDKGGDAQRRLAEAAGIVTLCAEHGMVSIINDDIGLALETGADGVHLGSDDADPAGARSRLGDDALIGVSCYDSLERAHAAQAAGCDYVAFGSAYPSPTKPGAVHAPLELYERAAAELDVPIVAIGGITPANAAPLVEAGCRAVAVISGIFGARDIRAAAEAYTACFGHRGDADRLE